MPQLFTNNAVTTLAAGITSGATSISLAAGTGALFPSPSGGDFFLATLFQRSGVTEINHEVVKVTARSTDTLTVTRGFEGTARAFSSGDPIELRFTAGSIIPVVMGGTGASTTAAALTALGAAGTGTNNLFTKKQNVGVIALTDTATISVDASLSNNFKVTLGGNRTLANPTNLVEGDVLNFRIAQDSTGSRVLTYGSMYKSAVGSSANLTLSTSANSIDFMSCYYDGSVLLCNLGKGYA
jgi:hypothetical protein